ncbi:MAG: hypothetical protein K2Y30_01830 [Flavobacteriaceae bacterium]|nr:hypothetical protein [Flavobacteriaceae bacterium]
MNTAKQLTPGDQFKWDNKQRDFRTVNKIVPVPESGPEQYRGGLIIVLSNCKTVVLKPDDEVIISTKSDV